MRFLVDECTGPAVARWLRNQSHEVFSVYEEARGTVDDDVLDKACNENWVLITNDRDFGEKVYREKSRIMVSYCFAFKMNVRRQRSTRLKNCLMDMKINWSTHLSLLPKHKFGLAGRNYPAADPRGKEAGERAWYGRRVDRLAMRRAVRWRCESERALPNAPPFVPDAMAARGTAWIRPAADQKREGGDTAACAQRNTRAA